MAINFDGKGNIESTTEDGVIAVKLYSLEKQIEKKDKEIERLKNIIYTTLEYVDREEVNSIGTPYTYTEIGKNIKELLEGERTFNSIWKENKRLNNIINELEWKPIDEYFKNKENYDWVLVKYYDKYNFECIPSVAEWRFDKWHLKDNEKSLQDFEVKYFFDMQQLDKLKELKEGK